MEDRLYNPLYSKKYLMSMKNILKELNERKLLQKCYLHLQCNNGYWNIMCAFYQLPKTHTLNDIYSDFEESGRIF